MSAPLLRLDAVSKRFGTVTALRSVSLAVPAARVTCLLGDNGAGKSTLIQILAGAQTPTTGRYLVDGRAVVLRSPREALDLGIATVYQDLALVPLMSVWRNFGLGSEPTRGRGPFRRIDREGCRRSARDGLAGLGIRLDDLEQPVATLSGGERQAVAIARAIHLGARVLILDEPTAALGVRQAGVVLDYVARLRERGLAVVLVTHNPQHAYAVGDRFVVLRRGEVVGDHERDDLGVQDLGELMSGGER